MHFSSSQKRLLKKIIKKSRLKSELSEKEIRHLSYFGDNGLIRYETLYEDVRTMKEKGTLIHIQPKGEAEYEYCIQERNRWLIPVIISVAALIISIIALISSSQSISVYIDNQKTSSFSNATSTDIINTAMEK